MRCAVVTRGSAPRSMSLSVLVGTPHMLDISANVMPSSYLLSRILFFVTSHSPAKMIMVALPSYHRVRDQKPTLASNGSSVGFSFTFLSNCGSLEMAA